jgi:hypothetical protein
MKRVVVICGAIVVVVALWIVVAGVTGTESVVKPAEALPEEDFIPSEELPADSAISFPVDI